MRTVPVTIFIPTRNGGELFRRSLAAIAALDPAPEAVLVIDSGSSDGSAELARDAGHLARSISPLEFDHGGTRQLGVELAATEFVAFLSQDSIPEPDYLGPLVKAMDDPQVAGATARVLPYADSSPLARRTVLAHPLAGSRPLLRRLEDGSLEGEDGAFRRRLCLFDNVASLARREFLLEHPFPRTMMGEDVHFAESALRAGRALAFVPQAVVHHAHEYGPLGAYRRYREDARFVRAHFGLALRPGLAALLRGFLYELREDHRFLSGEPLGAKLKALLRAPFLRAGQTLGQYAGSRARSA